MIVLGCESIRMEGWKHVQAAGRAAEAKSTGSTQSMYRLYSILDTLYYSQHLTQALSVHF